MHDDPPERISGLCNLVIGADIAAPYTIDIDGGGRPFRMRYRTWPVRLLTSRDGLVLLADAAANTAGLSERGRYIGESQMRQDQQRNSVPRGPHPAAPRRLA